ncbi:MAG: 30S ribosomal protein S21 [Candidatus Liptonbacteria bacterium]|nr:30S ribosomal protein S21 [Candidatus Liptonbacteria bacterium]
MIEVQKKEGESPSSLYMRFSKKVRRSGVILEVRKRRFYSRVVNRRKVQVSANHRATRAKEIVRLKKLGLSA